MTHLQQKTVRKLLDYDPETGLFTWKARDPKWFSDEKWGPEWRAAQWNSRCAGRPAFTTKKERGYLSGTIFGSFYRAHRIAWLYHYGTWPDEIDHINGDTSDNRIENLRSVSHTENMRNCKLRKDNSSGVSGVNWSKTAKKWSARCNTDNGRKFLGYFNCLTAARVAKAKEEATWGYHENHGAKR